MPLGDAADRPEHPLGVLLRRLPDELDPVALGPGEALPAAPVLLAQIGVDDDRQAEPLADD